MRYLCSNRELITCRKCTYLVRDNAQVPDKRRFNTDLPLDIFELLEALCVELSATRSGVVRQAILELAKARGIERKAVNQKGKHR
jgi:hypothetical protein